MSPNQSPPSTEQAEKPAIHHGAFIATSLPPPVPLSILRKCLPFIRRSAIPSLSRSTTTASPEEEWVGAPVTPEISPSVLEDFPFPSLSQITGGKAFFSIT